MSPEAMVNVASAALAQHVSSSANPVGVDVSTPTPTLDHLAASASAVLATAVATAASPATTAVPGDGNGNENGHGKCHLLGSFALFVQLSLGALALLSLVYKRWRERPQRPIKIWFFDVSKQVFGSVLVHGANIFMSILTSGRFSVKLEPGAVQAAARLLRRDDEPYAPNPCAFYLLNLAIDTTAGIPILILLLRLITRLVSHTPLGKPLESIESGHYGNPPNAWWWLKQSVIYFGGLFGMKICVLGLFLILPWISRIGDWALKWTEGNGRLQIVFVMMMFPLIMNAMQYYIIDSFIKKETDHERLSTEDPDQGRGPFEDALSASDEANESSVSSENVRLSRSATLKGGRKAPRASSEEYNPDLDGQTVIGSSSSEAGKAT